MNNIFIINGQKTSGKDYLVKELAKVLDLEAVNISTVDVVKDMYELIGYKEDDAKIKDKFRVVLSDAKDSIDKNLNDWTTHNCITRALDFHESNSGTQLSDLNGYPIFVHNREPEKIKLMVELFKEKGYNVRTLKVVADWQSDTVENATCHADANINDFDYDVTFRNTKHVGDFKHNLTTFIDNHIMYDENLED